MKDFFATVGATLLIVLPAAVWFVRQQISAQFASIEGRSVTGTNSKMLRIFSLGVCRLRKSWVLI